MHDAGRFHVDDDPLGRPRQVQLIGQVPASGRVITVAAEAFDGPDGTDYRPISAWPAERWERDAWYKEFGDAGDDD
ncbi:MAG: hypothetical protein ACRDI2_09135 [Chloroflexota bacterium]